MRKTLNTLIVSIMMILFCGSTLSAQEGLGKSIWVEFNYLSCGSSFAEVSDFIKDYEQYHLYLMFWQASQMGLSQCCNGAFFCFSTSSIDLEDIVSILQHDNRVSQVLYFERLPRPRQLAIKLSDSIDENYFLDKYEDYGLNGSELAYNYLQFDNEARYYHFNDSIVYPGLFIDLLKSDNDVISVDFVIGWFDGEILLSFQNWLDDEALVALFNDYNYIDFDYIAFPTYRASFDFTLFSEFDLVETMLSDERIRSSRINFIPMLDNQICLPVKDDPPTSISGEQIVSILSYSVFPNPAINSDITFKIETNEMQSRKNTTHNVSIFNLRGQLMKNITLIDHTYVWDGRDENNRYVSSGVYFFKINSGNEVQTGKFLIIK